MENNIETNQSKKSWIGLILGWVFGVIFGFAGLGFIFTEPVTGILFIIISLILLPPSNKLLLDKLNISIPFKYKAVTVLVLFVLVGVLDPVDSTDNNATNKTNSNSSVVTEQIAEEGLISEVQLDDVAPQIETDAVAETLPTRANQIDSRNNTPAVSSETLSQRNAVRKAKSYLNFSAFSRKGLIEQLEFEHFSTDDAIYGTDNSGADWYHQSAKKAEAYMRLSAFSRTGLIEQLIHEGFTQSQAEFGAKAVGF
jgi:hypothetical protein